MAELILTEGAAAATPSTGKVAIYVKSDGILYYKDDAGAETQVGSAGAHASSHENGGSDEIDVTGLSGVLADPQTPATHAHAAGDITSGTLVHERGGLEADVSAYAGLVKISGGATSQAVANTDYAAATHASRHQSGGADAIKLDDLAAPDDNTDLDASTAKHGLLKKLDNDPTHFLDGQGNWNAPASALDINGLSAIATELTISDQVPVYDASATANKKLPLASLLGLRNYIVNGDFSVFRGDSGGSNSVTFNDNAGSYANGWRFLGESNGSTKFRRASYATNGAKYKLILEVGTNNEKFGIWYTLPNDRVMELRGKTITLSVWLKVSNTRIGNVKMGVAESTGTVDQTGTDPISAWGGDGTTPTLTGWSFLNTPANLNVTTSSVRYTVTVTVGASANNLAVFLWNDDKTNTAADQLEIEDVQLEQGSIPTPYARLPEFMVCAIMQARILQVFLPQDNEPPSSSYATLDTRNGHPVLDFDDASTEAAIFSFVLSQRFGVYRASNAFDIILIWAATSATSGNVVWQASAERLALNDQDIDSDGFGSATTKTDAAQSTSGKLSYTKFGSTGISSDLMAAGEVGRLKIERVGGNGSDTMSGDAELKAVMIVEPFDVEMALPAA